MILGAWKHSLPWPPEPGAQGLSLMWAAPALQLWWDLSCFVGKMGSGALGRPGFDVGNLF